jgi:TRAP-type mannitol/chloroaromatic compound transport system substrate-binding protein
MKRRQFIKAGIATTAGMTAAPYVARAAQRFNWRMTTAWPPGLPMYQSGPGSAEYMAKKIDELSDGRLKIQVFAAGELIPAFGGFDAVSSGTVEANHACAYYWAGKHPATQFFTTVPFGMDFFGRNAWYDFGGGLKLWNELYADFNAVAMPCGCTGVQMTGWFRKPIHSMEDFKGLKFREVGLAGKIYSEIGLDIKLLPGGELFPALERGVIDGAEWVGPAQDRRLGLQNAAKYYYTTGWHEPSTTTELMISKPAWEKLPKDLQNIVQTVARDANLTTIVWSQANNGAALEDLVKNHGVKTGQLPRDIVKRLRKVTDEVLADIASKDPFTKKVYDSFMKFKKSDDKWAAVSEAEFEKIRDIQA